MGFGDNSKALAHYLRSIPPREAIEYLNQWQGDYPKYEGEPFMEVRGEAPFPILERRDDPAVLERIFQLPFDPDKHGPRK